MNNLRATIFRPTLHIVALAFVLAINAAAFAQSRTGQVLVQVRPDRADWTYKPGDPVKFQINVLQNGHSVPGVRASYKIGPEMMDPRLEKTEVVPSSGLIVEAGTMKEAGFLRCIVTVEVDGKTYRGLATAGFSPETIKPTIDDPADFDAFWAEGKKELAKIPLDAKLTLLPEYSTPSVNVYHVNLQNIGGDGRGVSRLYGILCEPKAEGKYPAVLSVPGAGVRPYRGMVNLAEKGIITFQIGIHGLPVILDQAVYDSLARGGLAGYMFNNLDNRNTYYYHRVYLGCVRANDFLTGLAKWNGQDLAVTGGSQGGALSIVTTALDPRVKGLAAFYPALSDMTGYLNNRAGGWPHMFRVTNTAGAASHRTKEKIETSKYYDVVNFARRVKVPGIYTWGFNDETCPPTSMYAAYNVIPGKKELLLALEMGHATVPEQTDRLNLWLETFLKHTN